jgi:CMP-N,N'-diacetyllegionaminic acid synthase
VAAPPTLVGLIPARAGSKRLAGKNTRLLAGHPLIAYTITAAIESGVFGAIVISTDSPVTAELARYYGGEVPFLRPAEYALDLSPDIDWLTFTLTRLAEQHRTFHAFSILRPTSPFRGAETIRRAWAQFLDEAGIDSLRAVERCKQHPGKMWLIEGNRMRPLLAGGPANPPWHSMAYQALPPVYVQNASLEIAWSRVPLEQGTIAGTTIAPFLTQGHEGVDLNDERDWHYAESLLASNQAHLPIPRVPPYAPASDVLSSSP